MCRCVDFGKRVLGKEECSTGLNAAGKPSFEHREK